MCLFSAASVKDIKRLRLANTVSSCTLNFRDLVGHISYTRDNWHRCRTREGLGAPITNNSLELKRIVREHSCRFKGIHPSRGPIISKIVG